MITIPTTFLDRLSRLALACDNAPNSALRHIACSIRGDRARLTATTGRLLVSVLLDADGEADRDCLLDAVQFCTAAKTRSSVCLVLGTTEARMRSPQGDSLIRIHPGTYPPIDSVFLHTADSVFVPSICSLDPHLVATAQRIIGKPTLLCTSPVPARSSVPSLWETDAQPSVTVVGDLPQLLRTAAFWTDGSWVVLLMPTTRVPVGHVDLVPFALQAAVAV